MPKAHRSRFAPSRVAVVVAALAAVLLYQAWSGSGTSTGAVEREVTPGAERVDEAAGERTILEAFRTRTSDLVVEGGGRVVRVLADDRQGSRHQRFIVELSSGHTLLMSHNIDLAPRVPLAVGDRLTFRGEYEWNAQGGVIHWTHHDPDGRRPGGWIRHGRDVYR